MGDCQRADHILKIYGNIVDDTILAARDLQSPAVLKEIKMRWMQNLKARLSGAEREGRSQSVQPVASLRPEVIPVSAPAWEEPSRADQTQTPSKDPSPAPSEGENADIDDDDDWGGWEETGDTKSAEEPKPAEPKPEPVTEAQEGPVGPSADDAADRVPKEEDFVTQMTTRYGKGTGTANINALSWDNPDECNSDLEEAEELSDVEPEARDLIVGQSAVVTRPAQTGGGSGASRGSKSSAGLWKIEIRNGIARLDGQEMFFDYLLAELQFR